MGSSINLLGIVALVLSGVLLVLVYFIAGGGWEGLKREWNSSRDSGDAGSGWSDDGGDGGAD